MVDDLFETIDVIKVTFRYSKLSNNLPKKLWDFLNDRCSFEYTKFQLVYCT